MLLLMHILKCFVLLMFVISVTLNSTNCDFLLLQVSFAVQHPWFGKSFFKMAQDIAFFKFETAKTFFFHMCKSTHFLIFNVSIVIYSEALHNGKFDSYNFSQKHENLKYFYQVKDVLFSYFIRLFVICSLFLTRLTKVACTLFIFLQKFRLTGNLKKEEEGTLIKRLIRQL